MPASGSVDVHAKDKGLLSCLQAANVQDPWIQAFQDVHRIESLEDFVFLVTHARWEDSLRELVNEVPSLKDNRLALARWKAAYTMGHSAIQQGNAPDKEALDIDNPIPEGQHSQLAAEWTRVYNLPLDPHLDPSDSLRGRIWREFRRRSLTLLELKRVKSIIGGSSPLEEERISLDAGVTLAFGKDTATAPKNVTDAYLRLRTLMNAWAFSGNFKMKCLDGQDKIAMPLHVAMNYADMCLRHTSSYGGNSLQWLLKNDLLTRGAMCAKVRRGICPAVALEESLRETHLEWRSPGVRVPEPPLAPTTPRGSGSKRHLEDEGPPTPPKVPARFQTVSMLKGGRKLCKAWNDSRGCNNRSCDSVHACDVRLPDGNACMRKDHNRANHPRS